MRRLFLLFGLITLLFIEATSAQLEDFPSPFTAKDTLLVVGSDSRGDVIIVQVDLMVILGLSGSNTVIDKQVTNKNLHMIILGGPNKNRLSAEIFEVSYPTLPSKLGIPSGKALIKYFSNAFDSKDAIVVAGSNDDATMMATRVLINYLQYDLRGKEILVSQTPEGIVLEYLDAESKILTCEVGSCTEWNGCNGNLTETRTCYDITCNTFVEERQCPICDAGWIGEPFCKDNNVWQYWQFITCQNETRLKENCTFCENGECVELRKLEQAKQEGRGLAQIQSQIKNYLNSSPLYIYIAIGSLIGIILIILIVVILVKRTHRSAENW